MSYTPKNPNGQATMANSAPVVLASDQSDVKVTLDGETIAGTVTANAGTNLNTSLLATETTLGTVHGHVDSIDTKTPALGQALAAASVPVVLTAAQQTALTPPAAITGFATETTLGTVHGHVDSLDTKTPALGQAAMAASSPVVIASNQSSVPVTLAAETTKVIGTARTADGAGNLYTTNSNTYTAKFAQDGNILGTLGTAFSTAGKVDVKCADGDIIVRQATATNLKTQSETYQGGVAVSAAAPMQVSLANHAANATAVKVNVASGGIASGAIASGAIASGALAAGSIASGAAVDGWNVTLGAKTDAKSTATDGTSITIMQVLKQISASVQAMVISAGTAFIGKLLPPDIDVTAHTNYARKYYTSTGAATDGIIWSPAAGKRWHVTSLIFQVSADATVTFEDDKAGGDDPVLKGEFKAGSGLALSFDEKYPFASGEDAADLTVTTSAGNIYVSVVGYEI